MTTAPIKASEPDEISPEWARDDGIYRLFGLKRSTVRNLFEDGRIKGIVLRVRGQKSGCRLWNVNSIRELIESEAARAAREASLSQN